MIEIVEHPVNDTIRKRNKEHLAAGENADLLVTDQELIKCDGVWVGWLSRHPTKPAGVSLIIRVDDETRDEIDSEVRRHIGESVPIAELAPDDEEETEEDDDES